MLQSVEIVEKMSSTCDLPRQGIETEKRARKRPNGLYEQKT